MHNNIPLEALSFSEDSLSNLMMLLIDVEAEDSDDHDFKSGAEIAFSMSSAANNKNSKSDGFEDRPDTCWFAPSMLSTELTLLTGLTFTLSAGVLVKAIFLSTM